MLPAGQEKQSPHISGLQEGPGAHRLGQMGLVQGDESAPQEEAASEVGTTSLPSMSQREPRLGSAGGHALLGHLSTHKTDKHKGMTCGPRWQGWGGGRLAARIERKADLMRPNSRQRAQGLEESDPERPGAHGVDLCLQASSPGLSLPPSQGPARQGGAGSGPGRVRTR